MCSPVIEEYVHLRYCNLCANPTVVPQTRLSACASEAIGYSCHVLRKTGKRTSFPVNINSWKGSLRTLIYDISRSESDLAVSVTFVPPGPTTHTIPKYLASSFALKSSIRLRDMTTLFSAATARLTTLLPATTSPAWRIRMMASWTLPPPPKLPALTTSEDNAQARSWLSQFRTHTAIPKELVELSFARSSGPGGQVPRLPPQELFGSC